MIYVIGFLVFVSLLALITDPYAAAHIFKSPYQTEVKNGVVEYKKVYDMQVRSSLVFNLYGYYKSGLLILKHRWFGARPIRATSSRDVLAHIYKLRFQPQRPYLISGDQFSVLYPRNLGVFYNQLLCPDIAYSNEDWDARQRLYLQSVLVATDALHASSIPRTTIVPIGRKTVTLSQVHPGSVASDSVYGLLFALDKLSSPAAAKVDGRRRTTLESGSRILQEERAKLEKIVTSYIETVRDQETGMVRADLHLASARDGVVRASSFYDNVVLWKTLELAGKYGLYDVKARELQALRRNIHKTFWQQDSAYYANDTVDTSFSSDWLIGYVCGFFDLSTQQDRQRAAYCIQYVESQGLSKPFPIKYQRDHGSVSAPFFVKLFVPNYGTNAIWSYWGCEYITLLAKMYAETEDQCYSDLAKKHLASYERVIVRDGGFPETFTSEGKMLVNPYYKSILMTGWAVQYDYARFLLDDVTKTA